MRLLADGGMEWNFEDITTVVSAAIVMHWLPVRCAVRGAHASVQRDKRDYQQGEAAPHILDLEAGHSRGVGERQSFIGQGGDSFCDLCY